MDKNAGVLDEVCNLLLNGKYWAARETLKQKYPFEPIKTTSRKFTISQAMGLFVRDGFIDRYTGNRLINPAVHRLLHVLLGDDFPAHQNWKYSETHTAFWELFPTVDHVAPVSRGGDDDLSNWVTTSMMRNQVKAQWSLEELGWRQYPPGDLERWDGLSRWLVNYLKANPLALNEATQSDRDYITRWLKVTKAALDANAAKLKLADAGSDSI